MAGCTASFPTTAAGRAPHHSPVEAIMFRLELNEQERQALLEALQSFLSELRTEVSHTDRQAYRQRLKTQEQVLHEILERMEDGA